MLYDELPTKIASIRKIRAQPFYGRDKIDFVIRYIYSHAFWFVGTWAGFYDVVHRCIEEDNAIDKKLKEIK